jgi:hypothetical protein
LSSDKEQTAYDELTAWSLSLRDEFFVHQHVVDAFAAQTATLASKPISIAFALAGLYLYLERGFSGREVQRPHMQMVQRRGREEVRRDWPRFPLPSVRRSISVFHVVAEREDERSEAIDHWCRSVWEDWKESHLAVAEWMSREFDDLSG